MNDKSFSMKTSFVFVLLILFKGSHHQFLCVSLSFEFCLSQSANFQDSKFNGCLFLVVGKGNLYLKPQMIVQPSLYSKKQEPLSVL